MPLHNNNDAQPAKYALICDDHPVVGRGLMELLKSHPEIALCAYTASKQECLDYLEAHAAPALVIVDFWLMGEPSSALVRALKQKGLVVLVISADDDPMIQQKSQDWGADGFISKQASPSVLIEAVTCLINGLGWFMPTPEADLQRRADQRHRIPVSARELGLTPRQGDTLALILEGYPNKKIADQLFVSEATVKEHITGIFQRLAVRSRVELIAQFKNRRIE
jgi:DNA-binding NarL/FixJ family response regulator